MNDYWIIADEDRNPIAVYDDKRMFQTYLTKINETGFDKLFLGFPSKEIPEGLVLNSTRFCAKVQVKWKTNALQEFTDMVDFLGDKDILYGNERAGLCRLLFST